ASPLVSIAFRKGSSAGSPMSFNALLAASRSVKLSLPNFLMSRSISAGCVFVGGSLDAGSAKMNNNAVRSKSRDMSGLHDGNTYEGNRWGACGLGAAPRYMTAAPPANAPADREPMDTLAEAGYAALWRSEGTSGEKIVNEAEWLTCKDPTPMLEFL